MKWQSRFKCRYAICEETGKGRVAVNYYIRNFIG